MAKRYIGSNFDACLEEEGLIDEVTAIAWKRYSALVRPELFSQLALNGSDLRTHLQ